MDAPVRLGRPTREEVEKLFDALNMVRRELFAETFEAWMKERQEIAELDRKLHPF